MWSFANSQYAQDIVVLTYKEDCKPKQSTKDQMCKLFVISTTDLQLKNGFIE